MKYVLLLSLMLLVFVIPAKAQDEAPAQPTYVVGTYQCSYAGLEALIERDRERALPILQALVDEGKLSQAGEAVHAWGDEYNLLTWLAAPDVPSALEAWQEMIDRYEEAYPDDNLFLETCPKHRDFFYKQRASTQATNPPPNEGNEPILALSYYTCDYDKLGDIVEAGSTRQLAIAQALVDEGAMGSQGFYTHEWGDEWNLVISRTAKDLPSLLSALTTMGERYEAEHGEEPRSLVDEHCTAHKDNVYSIVMVTN